MILVVVQYQEMNQDFLGTAMIFVISGAEPVSDMYRDKHVMLNIGVVCPNITAPTKSLIFEFDV